MAGTKNLIGQLGVEILERVRNGDTSALMHMVGNQKLSVNACFIFRTRGVFAERPRMNNYTIGCQCALTDFLTAYEGAYEDYGKQMVKLGKCKCIQQGFVPPTNRPLGSMIPQNNEEFKESYSLLHLACALGKIDLVDGLITRGCDVNMTSANLGASPLYVTVLKTPTPVKAQIMSKLIEAGCRVTTYDDPKCNALLKLVENILPNASKANFMEWFKILMSCGKDSRSSLYQTGLLPRGALASPMFLLCIDCLPKATGEKLGIIREAISYLDEKKFLKGFLQEFFYQASPFSGAAVSGAVCIMETLLRNTKKKDMKREEISAAMMAAIQKGNADIVELLLKHGANPNQLGVTEFDLEIYCFAQQMYMSPLWSAAVMDHYEIVEILVEAGADVNMPCGDEENFYPFVASMHSKDPDSYVAEYLLEHGAVPEFPNMVHNHTGMHAAAKADKLDLLSKMFEMGVTLDMQDEFGYTPLMYAMENYHFYFAETLLNRGANANAENKFGSTPLHYCGYFGSVQMTKALLQKGADINKIDPTGASALWYAIANGNEPQCINTVAEMLAYNPRLEVFYGSGYNFENKTRIADEFDDGVYAPQFMFDVPHTLMQVTVLKEKLLLYKEANIAKTLLMLGCPLDCNVLEEANEDFLTWFREFESKPQSLANLCRVNLRKYLPSGKKFIDSLESLNLPTRIVAFLKVEGEIYIDESKFPSFLDLCFK